MHTITPEEIGQIRTIVEDAVGTLMLLQEGNFNDAEKLRLFMTCTRTLGRTILWGTTIDHYQLNYFIWRCSFGLIFDVDAAIEYLISYGCAILDEIEFHEKRLTTENLIQDPEEEDCDDTFEY